MTTPTLTDPAIVTALEESFGSDSDLPCECEHWCGDDSCENEHLCGERAAWRVTTPCCEDGCPNAGMVELLCHECAAERVAYYGEGRVTKRPLAGQL
jgi:hypothetical protein